MNSKEGVNDLIKLKFYSKLKLPKFMIVNLYLFRKSIESIIKFNNYLKENLSDNKIIKAQIFSFDKYINEFNLDRDFEEILSDMKNNEGYIELLSEKIDNILKE